MVLLSCKLRVRLAPEINLLGFTRGDFQADFGLNAEGDQESFKVLFGELIVGFAGH